jgi:hypothetical protein
MQERSGRFDGSAQNAGMMHAALNEDFLCQALFAE